MDDKVQKEGLGSKYMGDRFSTWGGLWSSCRLRVERIRLCSLSISSIAPSMAASSNQLMRLRQRRLFSAAATRQSTPIDACAGRAGCCTRGPRSGQSTTQAADWRPGKVDGPGLAQ